VAAPAPAVPVCPSACDRRAWLSGSAYACRHENAVLRYHVGRVRYEPADRVWFAALARLGPRRRWTGVFRVTPATRRP